MNLIVHGSRCVAKGLPQIFVFQKWVFSKNLVVVWIRSEQFQNSPDSDSHATDAGLAAALVGLDGDPVEGRCKGHRFQFRPNAWFFEVKRANWRSSQDVKRAYASASIIDAERAVFNIKGNSYRLVVSINYELQTVFIKWVGSHKEYDTIDVRTVEYGNQAYQKRPGPR